MSKIKFKENQLCPECKSIMLMLYGCGWDYDRLICGNRDCNFEVEFESSTYIEEMEDE